MNRQDIIDRLRENERALRARGVVHAALFGSRARGDNGPDSDIDIMIDIEPEASKTMGVYELVGIQLLIGGLFEGPVDVVEKDSLKRYIKPAALRDAVHAF